MSLPRIGRPAWTLNAGLPGLALYQPNVCVDEETIICFLQGEEALGWFICTFMEPLGHPRLFGKAS